MLHDPERHEALAPIAWDAGLAREAIARIVADTEQQALPDGSGWPPHPQDVECGDPQPCPPFTALYHGACGVIWALHYLQDVGAVPPGRRHDDRLDGLRHDNHAWLGNDVQAGRPSYLTGDTPFLMLAQARAPTAERADELAALIAGNLDHPARELMWGSPGTLLAALFLHQRDGDARWAALFNQTAQRLWSQREWSAEHGCHFWSQDLYGHRCSCLDAVHGFAATAAVLIRGRHLLPTAAWDDWAACITRTMACTATWEGEQATWRNELFPQGDAHKKLMQFCHGAPGIVTCLADLPGSELDALLCAAGEATWAAGPLRKGSNLCHGTGGNGYAFLKLFQRTGDALWLDRARAFAMHGIAQTEADAARYGQRRHSLWTGDIGVAIYLWDCLRGQAAFPTLDVFHAPSR